MSFAMSRVIVGCVLLSTIVGCDNSPSQLQAERIRVRRATFVTTTADTISLAYVCGNAFRVTHTGAIASDSLRLFWTTMSGDTGSIRLFKKLPGRTFTEAIFYAPSSDTVEISGFGGTLREANGGISACTPSRDTAWTRVFASPTFSGLVDTTQLLVSPSATDTVFGRSAQVVLSQSIGVSRDTIAKTLGAFGIRVAAATPMGWLSLRIDDARPTYSGYQSLLDSLRGQPIFDLVVPANVSDASWVESSGRSPVDGTNFTRSNWDSRSSNLWPYLQSRLDLAWACENGRYGTDPTEIAFLEAMPLMSHSDLDGGRVSSWYDSFPSGTNTYGLAAIPVDTLNRLRAHSLAVTGTAVAIADNATGVPGVIWRGKAKVFSRLTNVGTDWYADNFNSLPHQIEQIAQLRPRVLNLSSFLVIQQSAKPADKALRVAIATRVYSDLLNTVPELVIVMATGNDGLTNYQNFTSKASSYPAEQIALFDLRANPSYSDRIVTVTASNSSGGRPSFANDFSGKTDVAAPGESIRVLKYPSLSYSDIASGTSISSPFVAGLLALQFTMDSTLTPSQAKQQLLSGASFRKGRDASGAIIQAKPLTRGGSVYPIDAYSTLMHTSERVSGLPICGATVTFEDGSVLIKHLVNGTERVGPTPPDTGVGGVVSLAPGGRKLALNTEDAVGLAQTWTAMLSANRQWLLSAPTDNVWKYYANEDTVTLNLTGYPILASVMQDSASRRVANTPLSLVSRAQRPQVAPNGDWLLAYSIETAGSDPECSNGINGQTTTEKIEWIPLRGGGNRTAMATRTTNSCSFGGTPPTPIPSLQAVAWSEHSDTAVVALYRADSGQVLRRWSLRSSTPTRVGAEVNLAQWDWINAMATKPGFGEFRLLMWEDALSQCVSQDIVFGSPATLVAYVSFSGLLDPCAASMAQASRAADTFRRTLGGDSSAQFTTRILAKSRVLLPKRLR